MFVFISLYLPHTHISHTYYRMHFNDEQIVSLFKRQKKIFKKKYIFVLQVKAGSPAQGTLLRGDVIVKIQEYDARDVRNIDAQTLFRSAAARIRVVVMRDSKLIVASNMQNDTQKSRSPSAVPPYRPDINLLHYDFNEATASLVLQSPFQAINSENGSTTRPNSRISNFSPMPTRDHQQEVSEEITAITTQVWWFSDFPDGLNELKKCQTQCL